MLMTNLDTAQAVEMMTLEGDPDLVPTPEIMMDRTAQGRAPDSALGQEMMMTTTQMVQEEPRARDPTAVEAQA